MSPANRLNPGLRHTEMFDLSLGNQVLDRSCHILDRHIRVDAMLIEEIDVIGPQTLQAGVSHSLICSGRLSVPDRACQSQDRFRSRTWWRS